MSSAPALPSLPPSVAPVTELLPPGWPRDRAALGLIHRSSSILFVQSNLEDAATLLAGLDPAVETVVLDATQDAIAQITQTLAGRQNIASLHLLSHGRAAEVDFGSTVLNADTIDHYRPDLQAWAAALTPDADILFYGCDLAAQPEFLAQIAALTGADVAGSSNLTGGAERGGDWILEVSTGEISAQLPFAARAMAAYTPVLDATYHNLAGGSFTQNWSTPGLITANNNWNNVPSLIGYRGDGLTAAPGTDPQTVLANGSATPVQVTANQSNPAAAFAGGLAEFDGLANPTIAFQGSATAAAPNLVLHLNATGQQNVRVSFTARDIDDTGANAVQAIGLQYRIGTTGNFINLPDGYVPDATALPSFNGRQARLSVLLPTSVNNQAQVQVRWLTTNAAGFDEWVGIDDIQVTSSTIAANAGPVAVNDSYTIAENATLTTASSITAFEMDSDAGNYVGAGEFYRYRPYNLSNTFIVERSFNNNNSVRIYFIGANPVFGSDFWSFNFSAIGTDPLVAGTTYTGATRQPFQAPTVPGLDASGNGRGYNTLTGEFTVNQIVYGPGTEIVSFDATFRENGDGDPIAESFRGRVRYRATGSGLLPGVLANDTDAEGSALTASLVTNPSNGTVTLNPDGSFSYTPNPGFNGVDSFTYRASDAIANSIPATVNITVTGINDPPVNTAPATVTTPEDTPIAFTGANQISIADPDAGSAIVRTTLSLPANRGSLSLTPQAGLTIANNNSASLQLDGTIAAINAGLATLIYTPTADLNSTIAGGSIPLTIVTTDLGNTGAGGPLSDTDTVNLTIVPVNDAPQFTPGGNLTIAANSGLQSIPGWATTFRPGPATAIDEASQTLTFQLTILSTTGDLTFTTPPSLNPNGTLSFAVAPNTSGTALVSVQLTDSGTANSTQPFTIAVTPPPTPPVTPPITPPVTPPLPNPPTPQLPNSPTPQPPTLPLGLLHLGDFGRTHGVYQVGGETGQAAAIQFDWIARRASFNNEIGCFQVDDDLGRVNGLAPGEVGYAAAAIARGRVLFASGQGAGAGTDLVLNGGDRLVFYLVQNNTTAHWRLANPQNSLDSAPVFFSVLGGNRDRFDHARRQTLAPGSVRLDWEDLTAGGDRDFNDVVFTAGPASLALPNSSTSESTVSLTVRSTTGKSRATLLTNRELGLFFSDDPIGRIGTLLPGDRDYAAAALGNGNSRIVFANGQRATTTQLTLPAGRFLNWYLIQESTAAELLAQNPTNQASNGPVAFFSLSAANGDRTDHFRRFSGDEFGFVDPVNASGDRVGDVRFQVQVG